MLINISKIVFVIFLFYVEWFQVVFFQIPSMLILLGACMMIFIILHAIQKKIDMGKMITPELLLWILFTLSSLFIGMLIVDNYSNLISSIFTFGQFLVLMYYIVYISDKDGNVDFFINTYIILTILSAITTIFWGIDYGEGGRMSMGLRNNPNALGTTMVAGIAFILYKLDFKKIYMIILLFSSIFLLFYVVILTGSRTSMLSFVLIIIYWFVFVFFEELKVLPIAKKLKSILSIVILLSLGYYIFYPLIEDSIILNRLQLLFEKGTEVRGEMYLVALDLFKKNPLIGVGFNNYREITIFQTYSHSTYAESLACTGIVGSILYFIPYLVILYKYKGLVTSIIDDTVWLARAKVFLGLFFVLLFLGTGVIHFYETTSSIVFGIIIAFSRISKERFDSRNYN